MWLRAWERLVSELMPVRWVGALSPCTGPASRWAAKGLDRTPGRTDRPLRPGPGRRTECVPAPAGRGRV